jgi:DNA polymerase-3 subunit delta'
MARSPAVQEMEALPEADRLEGFAHPRETAHLYGHDAAEQVLAQAFAAGRMHHAWLFAGRSGIGKATLAYRLAQLVLATPGERDPAGRGLEVRAGGPTRRQIAALSHPGLLLLRRPYDTKSKRFAASIPVDEVRKLKAFLGLTAGEGAWRVVIVDSADELNLNAANALLKSLEEPPRRALFVLISSEPGRLLPTIRSRCRRLDLLPLAGEPLRRAVQEALAAADMEPLPAQEWDKLIGLADGSVRRALQLAAGDGLELHARVQALVSQLPKVDWAALHALADGLGLAAQEQRYELFFEFLLDKVAQAARSCATGQQHASGHRLIREPRLPELAALWAALVRDKAATDELNLDRKALILRTLARLQAVSEP